MLAEYTYRSSHGKFGWYQCDTDDLKQFVKAARDDLMWLVVELQDGTVWVWSGACGWYKKRKVPWWASK